MHEHNYMAYVGL